MRVCVPITAEGQVDPRWGRADRVAVASVVDGEIADWQEFTVGWGTLHDEGTEGAHHARVARFLWAPDPGDRAQGREEGDDPARPAHRPRDRPGHRRARRGADLPEPGWCPAGPARRRAVGGSSGGLVLCG